ncbi:MAG: hypothetical protein FJ009_20780 [Chloroflexi bacterium]|nr:hypothetical protein [Chloroflexota bacterium]
MAKRRKPQRKNSQAMVARLEQQLRASGKLPEGTQFVRREDGDAKISAAFLRFIEPFRYAAPDRKRFETLIGLGVAAWNVSLFEGAKRQEMLVEVSKTMFSETGQPAPSDLMGVLDDLIRHKERRFAHDRRLILSYQLDVTRDQYHLSMISTEEDEAQDP